LYDNYNLLLEEF
jgi:chromosome segregation ATPase